MGSMTSEQERIDTLVWQSSRLRRQLLLCRYVIYSLSVLVIVLAIILYFSWDRPRSQLSGQGAHPVAEADAVRSAESEKKIIGSVDGKEDFRTDVINGIKSMADAVSGIDENVYSIAGQYSWSSRDEIAISGIAVRGDNHGAGAKTAQTTLFISGFPRKHVLMVGYPVFCTAIYQNNWMPSRDGSTVEHCSYRYISDQTLQKVKTFKVEIDRILKTYESSVVAINKADAISILEELQKKAGEAFK